PNCLMSYSSNVNVFLKFFLTTSCFVFQAEDGIRDRNVTGVQTCALPIFAFLIAAFSFLSLTFIDISISLQIVYNVTFLIGVPLLLFVWYKNDNKMEPVTMLIFWFIFLGAKYYDYLWTLLHKSI